MPPKRIKRLREKVQERTTEKEKAASKRRTKKKAAANKRRRKARKLKQKVTNDQLSGIDDQFGDID